MSNRDGLARCTLEFWGSIDLADRTLRSHIPAAWTRNCLDIGQTRALRGPSPGSTRVRRSPPKQPGVPGRDYAAC